MRKILFRGKTKSGDWVYGGITPSLRGTKFFIGNMFECDEVISETVGEFTGLYDNKYNKIFEGDVIAYDDASYVGSDNVVTNYGVIVYGDGVWGFTNAVQTTMDDLVYKDGLDCEVVGNIFDNPELMQEV
jgi:uncharacterized phage protein (TIGR01671 family)